MVEQRGSPEGEPKGGRNVRHDDSSGSVPRLAVRSELVELTEELPRLAEVVSGVTASLVEAVSQTIDETMDRALGRVAGYLGASAAFIIELARGDAPGERRDPDRPRLAMTHLWTDGRLLLDRRDLANIPLDALPWWSAKIHAGVEFDVPSLADLPPDASMERSLLSAQGVRSLVSVPCLVGGKPVGALGCYLEDEGAMRSSLEMALLRSVVSPMFTLLARRSIALQAERSERQLAQAQRMLAIGRLAGGVAHDFNNFLTGVLGYTEEARSLLREDDPAREELDEIASAAERATDLTKQLLAFSGKQLGQRRPIPAGDVVAATHRTLTVTKPDHVTISLTRAEEPWEISIDPAHLQQIVLNLARNAFEAMPNGGQLTLSTSQFHCSASASGLHSALRPGDYVVISVSDEGLGIAPGLESQIFEPFFTTKAGEGHKGLGLGTVYGLVKQNEGVVEVTSELGVGTTFSLFFPRVRALSEASRESLEHRLHPGGATETVLLVEDDLLVRGLTRRVLERQGYRVIEASSGAEALRLVEREGILFDLLLSDVVMPGMNGPDLFARLVKDRPRLGCLFMSGYAEDVVVHHGMGERQGRLLSKPFSADKLVRVVREVLEE